MNDIMDLVNKKVKSNSILHKSDMCDVIECLKYNYGLLGYIKNIEFGNIYGDCALYRSSTGQIFVDRKRIKQESTLLYNLYYSDGKISYNNFCLYLQLIILFHETKHAIQDMDESRGKLNVNNYINWDSRKIPVNVYEKYYDINPREKGANTFANVMVFNLFNNSKYVSNEMLIPLKDLYYRYIIKGYNYANWKDGTLEYFYDNALHSMALYKKYCPSLDSLEIIKKIGCNYSLTERETMYVTECFNNENREKCLSKLLCKKVL